ncbi:hypothetical protein LGH83_15550 [Lichenihabitans sp. PAMC28606]|uniref:hypothetical protein n=1 Tax=Lichenihabitans sp. PAMC28606 TaxID=2880932 RepID=UPI001D0B11EE|nr:hypothetical protein [Lichenihabitans sp. PAMC28606]UDL93958.1 hypothetical protein LGH83_15550 [Lichenihabitans sp. PAMC28606]
MTSKTSVPDDRDTAPVESRRASATTPVGGVSADEIVTEDGQGSVLDVPNMGEFSAEAARPTPLDDIAAAERENMPKD